MKNMFLKSALLTTAFVLSAPSAIALEMQLSPPYMASTNADGDIDSTNTLGATAESSVGMPYTFSQAYTTEYTLGAESRVSVKPQVWEAKDVIKVKEYSPNLYTHAEASFSQRFVVNSAGQATIRFDWDGELYSDGVYGAGYNFQASTGRYGNHYNSNSTSGGSINVDLFKTFTIDFTANDIGSTFDVSATLRTWAGNQEPSDSLEGMYIGLNGMPQPGYAYADFFNTATLSIGGTSGVIAPAAVPVPAAVWLFGSALMGLVGIRRKKTTA
ncbi:MAG: hypothetical protein AB8D52_10855 [Gammaproteobacteria bacterium]